MSGLKVGDRARVMFREHSIPIIVTGVVIEANERYVTVKATDGWQGEAGNLVCVPLSDAECAS